MSAPVEVRELSEAERSSFAAARLAAVRRQPYLAAAIFALRPLAAPGLGTFAVDRYWRLYLDPECLAAWGAVGAGAVVLHEAGHVVRDHAGRADVLGAVTAADRWRWNVACDLAINDDLVADRVVLPGTPLLPGGLGLDPFLIEEDYHQRLRPAEAVEGAGGGEVEGGAESRPDRAPCAGDCGSGADGVARTWEEAPSAGVLPGAAARAIRISVARSIKHTGSAPEGWRRWAGACAAAPATDWRRVLRTAVRAPRSWHAGRGEPTWTRPHRREGLDPAVLAAGWRAARLEIAVVIDTSGSVSDEELAAMLAEVDTVRRQAGAEALWVVSCDATPGHPQRVRRVEQVEMRGGGGTDLRPALALLPGLRPRPDVAVVLTDGWTPWPDRPPGGIPVVVATTDRGCDVPGFRTVEIGPQR